MLVPTYRYRPSPLHAARAGATTTFCAALCLVAVLYDSPPVLAGALAATVVAGAAAGAGAELRRASLLAVPIALLLASVNALVSREGETLLLRGGELLGWRLDVTLEAVAYGAVAGLRVVVVVLALALFSSCVDPDETLRLFRRLSYRSALTASLATRLVPVLARDALRMGEATRCRARPAGRATVARATLRGALDRAIDLAAALELRGYAGARRPARSGAPWSRHDLRVGGAGIAIAALAVGARVAGVGGFVPYPQVAIALGPAEAGLAVLLPGLALAPFAGAGARLGVARA
jgi:energy-coupling factor transport system permease protein